MRSGEGRVACGMSDDGRLERGGCWSVLVDLGSIGTGLLWEYGLSYSNYIVSRFAAW